MSKITGSEVRGLMEAYGAVYAPQQLTEEQIWEEVETWVNSLIEEGYDLSDYTWEEMYENYIEEQGRGGPPDAEVQARWRSIGNTLATGNPQGRRPEPSSRPTNVRGGGTTRPRVSNIPPQEGTGRGAPTGRVGNIPPSEGTGRGGPSDIRPARPAAAPAARPSGGTPAAPARPSGGAPRPAAAPAARPSGGAPAAAKPVPSAASQTGDKAKDMATWAKANPKLAAASAERERTRGTSATTNPLMSDMKSRLPAPKPATPSPSPSQASSAFTSPTIKAAGNLAAPSSVKPTNTQAASPKPTPVAPTRAPIKSHLDLFDIVKGHLLDEGYADTEEAAEAIMVSMSGEWRTSILEKMGGGAPMDNIEKSSTDPGFQAPPPAEKKKFPKLTPLPAV